MAVDFIDELYREANIGFSMKKMLKYSRCQQLILLEDLWNEQIEQIVSFCKQTATWDEKLGAQIWDLIIALKDYIDAKDSVRMADLIEEIIPLLYDAMALRGNIDVEEGDYRFFSSKSGFLSIENTKLKQVMVSAKDPAFEAFEKASVMCNPSRKVFCTFGCELGYLAWQMYEVSGKSLDIFVYEDDPQKIEYARSYGVLDWIDEDKLNIIVENDTKKLFNEMINRHLTLENEMLTSFYIEGDLFEHLSGAERNLAVEILQNLGTELNYIGAIERNFYLNYKSVSKTVDDIDRSELGCNWIIVGGGPSVDYNIDYLKEEKGKSVIIAVSTIVKRLLNEAVRPDYIIAIDMVEKLYKHIEGIEDIGIPLIMSDYVNWRFGEKYKGEKYLIPTDGKFFSKELYRAANIKPWNAPGTVTSAAIDVVVRLGAKTITLVGVDLAYPGNYSHAGGTLDYQEINKEGCIKVPAVNGGEVETTLFLKAFLREIEWMIRNNPGVSFYNKSKYGALIQGCKNV